MSGTRYLLSMTLLLVATSGAAQNTGILAGLDIASHTRQLDFGTAQRKTRIDSIDIYWYEPLGPRIDGGLLLGYQEITQASNPIAAGQALSGEYLGLTLRIQLLQGEHFSMFSDFRYRYSRAASSLAGQDIDWQWHEGQAELGLELKLGQSLALGAAAGVLHVNGRERASGTINQVTDFDSPDSAYARGGIKLLLDPYSHIGIEGSAGTIKGGHIYFQRYF